MGSKQHRSSSSQAGCHVMHATGTGALHMATAGIEPIIQLTAAVRAVCVKKVYSNPIFNLCTSEQLNSRNAMERMVHNNRAA